MESNGLRFQLSYPPSRKTLIPLRHISSSSLSEYSPCASIEPADRLTCGWVDITENVCKRVGCCYQSGACFKTDGHSSYCKYQLICSQQAHLQSIWHSAFGTARVKLVPLFTLVQFWSSLCHARAQNWTVFTRARILKIGSIGTNSFIRVLSKLPCYKNRN